MPLRRSNCLVVALVVARRTRGRLRWWPGWSNGWWEWPGHPWGHFYVELRDGTTIHWHDLEPKDLPPWRQLWFEGRLVRRRPAGGR